MSVKISFKDGFHKSAKVFNKKQRDKLADLVVLLSRNPFNKKLHTKPLGGKLAGLYSFRITRDWRVIFKFLSPQEILVIKVGNRKDIYK